MKYFIVDSMNETIEQGEYFIFNNYAEAKEKFNAEIRNAERQSTHYYIQLTEMEFDGLPVDDDEFDDDDLMHEYYCYHSPMEEYDNSFAWQLAHEIDRIGYTQKATAEMLEIPLRTLEDWKAGKRTPPKYTQSAVLSELKKINPSD